MSRDSTKQSRNQGTIFDLSTILAACETNDTSEVKHLESVRETIVPRSTTVRPAATAQTKRQQQNVDGIEIASRTRVPNETEAVDRLGSEIAKALSEFGATTVEDPPETKKRAFRNLARIANRQPKPPASVLCDTLIKVGQTGDSRAFALVLKFIRSRTLYIRQAAVSALGLLHERRCVPTLLRCLNDRRTDVALAAASSLAACAEPLSVRPVLAFGLAAAQNRVAAIDSIVQMGEAVVPAIAQVANGIDLRLAELALVTLSKFDNDAAKEAVRRFIGHSQTSLCRNAITAFAGFATRKDAKVLHQCLDDQRPEIRRAAARALVWLSHPANVKPLLKLILRANEPVEVLAAAAEALGATENPRALAGLCRLVERDDSELNYVIAEAIGRLGNDSELAVSTLLKLADSDETRVKFRSVVALTRLNDSRAIPVIIGSLEDDEASVRRLAVVALGQIDGKDAVRRIIQRLKSDPSDEVRAAAAKALGKPGRKSSIVHLENSLRDEVNVRCQAVMSLGVIGDKTVMPILMQSLKDPAPEVRCQSIDGLVKLKNATVIPSFVECLNDSDAMVARAAEKGLRNLGANRQILGSRLQSRLAKTRKTILPDYLIGLAFNPVMLVGCLVLGLSIWGARNFMGAETSDVAVKPRGSISGLAYGPDGDLAVVTRGGWLEVWNPSDGTIRHCVEDAGGREVAFQTAEQIVISSATQIVTYSESPESSTLESTPLVKDLDHRAESMCVSLKGVFALSGQATLKAVTGMPAKSLSTARLRPNMIEISPDGGTLFTVSIVGTVTAMEVETGKPLASGRLDRRSFGTCMAVSPDGRRLAVGTTTGKISLREIDSFKEATVLSVPGQQRVRAIEFLPNSETLVICDDLGVTIWPLLTGEPIRLKCIAAEQSEVVAAAFDGKTIAVASRSDDVIRIVNPEDDVVITTLKPQ